VPSAAEFDKDKRSIPSTLWIAAVLVGLEGLVVLALAVAEALAFDSARPQVAIGSTLIFALVGGGLLLAARGLSLGHPRAPAPVIVVQVFLLLLAFSLRGEQISQTAARWSPALMVVALSVVALVLVGPSRRAFSRV
jgi:peptidoglycan/LPS O-acetylase OafA/YrhL